LQSVGGSGAGTKREKSKKKSKIENLKSFNLMDKKSSNTKVYESKYLSLGRPSPPRFLQLFDPTQKLNDQVVGSKS
jgi:hypothetical protein